MVIACGSDIAASFINYYCCLSIYRKKQQKQKTDITKTNKQTNKKLCNCISDTTKLIPFLINKLLVFSKVNGMPTDFIWMAHIGVNSLLRYTTESVKTEPE